MWKSRLEGKDVVEDVRFLAEKLHDFATTNQILINYDNAICKMKRMDYYPEDDGSVIFYKEERWIDDSYSVAELLEFIEKYGTLIKDMKFQASDGSLQPFVTITETCDNTGVVWYTHIIVGDGSRPITEIVPKRNQLNLYNPNVKVIV